MGLMVGFNGIFSINPPFLDSLIAGPPMSGMGGSSSPQQLNPGGETWTALPPVQTLPNWRPAIGTLGTSGCEHEELDGL